MNPSCNFSISMRFTIELPTQNNLPYLDTLVSFNPTTNKFTTTRSVKPIYSQCITPWDSHGSIASKRSILIGQTRKAGSRSTDSLSSNKSLHEIKSIFTNNEYPKKFINSVMRQTLHTQPQRENNERSNYRMPCQ